MELSDTPDRVEVSYERVGGIVRITGTALIRHPTGDIRQPVTIVIRQEDAASLGPALMGRLHVGTRMERRFLLANRWRLSGQELRTFLAIAVRWGFPGDLRRCPSW